MIIKESTLSLLVAPSLSLLQGLVFGYATNEMVPEYMPLTVILSHQLNKKMADCRRDKTLAWVRPDSKSQVYTQWPDIILAPPTL